MVRAAGLLILTLASATLFACQRHFEMRPAARRSDHQISVTVIGGNTPTQDWPATFTFKGPNDGPCTGTAVGPQVILVAAHCIENQTKGTILLGGRSVDVDCEPHPNYVANTPISDPALYMKTSADFGLCWLATALSNMTFETIEKMATPAKGDSLTLVGYGCTQSGGSTVSPLNQGAAEVDVGPGGTNYFYTTTGGNATCLGDSGGGAYSGSGNGRRLVGVNSRSDMMTTSHLATPSYIPPSGFTSFVAWANRWSSTHQVSICGLDSNAVNCRQ